MALALRAKGPGARAQMKWYLYILKSEKDKKRYIGSTNNLKRRISEHNSGKVPSTKGRRPFVLIYKEEFTAEIDARLREKFFKTHKGFNTLKKILLTGSSSVG